MRKLSKVIFIAVVIVLMTRLIRVDAGVVPPEERIGGEPFRAECTAYCDSGITASGKPTVEGLTLGGAPEWIGCMAVLYEVDADGSIGGFIGIYEVMDTGWGRDGDAVRGETVDVFIPDYDACIQWGRRDVYVQIIDGRG
ncbi:MAG: hypothetical protein ACLT3H_12545 [Roseburia sp.]